LDESVAYEHLSDFAPELSKVSTPDWLVYLAASAAGFDGVVTRDQSQIEQREELVVLDRSSLSVVTWRKGLDDPVTEWGLLVAYMPLILKHIGREGPAIFLLPKPNLDPRNIINKREAAYQLAKSMDVSFPEMRSGALILMREELGRRGRDDLLPELDRTPGS
jgi:hypothetical protein